MRWKSGCFNGTFAAFLCAFCARVTRGGFADPAMSAMRGFSGFYCTLFEVNSAQSYDETVLVRECCSATITKGLSGEYKSGDHLRQRDGCPGWAGWEGFSEDADLDGYGAEAEREMAANCCAGYGGSEEVNVVWIVTPDGECWQTTDSAELRAFFKSSATASESFPGQRSGKAIQE